jgi:RNA polymerase-binding transcription factor DksA
MQARDGTEDYIDYAVSSYDRDFLLSLTEMDRQRLRMVEDALKRLEGDEFGRCQQCSVEIPERRLEVEPWARYCVRCQELDDQGLLQHGEFETDQDEDDLAGGGDDDGDEEDELVEADDDEEELEADSAESSDDAGGDEDSEEEVDL